MLNKFQSRMLPEDPKKQVLFLLGCCFLVFFINNGFLIPDIMEARNLITAKEMILKGNWWVPTMNDYPRLAKPPFPTWLTAFVGLVGGYENLPIVRIPSALAATMMVYFLFRLVKLRQAFNTAAYLSGLILATSFYLFYLGKQNTWDIYCHAFMLGAIFFYTKGYFNGNMLSWKNALLIGLFWALSYMSKGPIPIYAMLMPFVVAFIITHGGDFFIQHWQKFLTALGLSILLSLIWPLIVYLQEPEALAYMVKKESGNWINHRVRPWYQYWNFPIQSGLWAILGFAAMLLPMFAKKVFQDRQFKLFWWWTIIAVILLSLIPEKKERYLMPVLIPLAATIALSVPYLNAGFKSQWRKSHFAFWSLNHLLFGIIALALPIAGAFYWTKGQFPIYLWVIGIPTSIFLLALIWRSFGHREYTRLMVTGVVLMVAALVLYLPLVNPLAYKNELFDLRNFRENEAKEGLPLYGVGYIRPQDIWQIGDSVDTLKVDHGKILHTNFPMMVFSEEPLRNLVDKTYTIDSLNRYYYHPQSRNRIYGLYRVDEK